MRIKWKACHYWVAEKQGSRTGGEMARGNWIDFKPCCSPALCLPATQCFGCFLTSFYTFAWGITENGRRTTSATPWTNDNERQIHKGGCSGWAPMYVSICEQISFPVSPEIHGVGEQVLGHCLQTSDSDAMIRWTQWGPLSVWTAELLRSLAIDT